MHYLITPICKRKNVFTDWTYC